MPDWKLEIRRVDNGFILKGHFDDAEMETEKVIAICDEIVTPPDNITLRPLQDLLWAVREYFDMGYNKHADRNVNIILVDENGNEIEE